VCVSLCTTIVHNTAHNSSDNVPSRRPDAGQPGLTVEDLIDRFNTSMHLNTWYLAILLLSVLRTRRMTETPAFMRKCWARSETPFSVMTRSGLTRSTSLHISCTISSSSCRIRLRPQVNSITQMSRYYQSITRSHQKSPSATEDDNFCSNSNGLHTNMFRCYNCKMLSTLCTVLTS